MKKEAIIEIIEHDLNEIKTLLETFKDAEKIPTAFLDLLSSKHAALGKEIMLLEFWKDTTNSIPKTSEQRPNEQPTPVKEAITTVEAENDTDTEHNTNLDFCVDNSDNDCIVQRDSFSTPATEENTEATSVTEPKVEAPTETEATENPKIVVEAITETPAEKVIPATQQQPSVTPAEVVAQPTKQPTPQPQARKNAPSVADITNYGLPVDDIRKAITIADRFLYQRELFGSNNETMNNTLEAINGMPSYEEAYMYITASFSWDETDPTVENFLKTMHRRFL